MDAPWDRLAAGERRRASDRLDALGLRNPSRVNVGGGCAATGLMAMGRDGDGGAVLDAAEAIEAVLARGFGRG